MTKRDFKEVELLKYKLTSHAGGKASDEFNYSLLTVYDVQKRGFRNINLETVQQYTVAGRTFKQEWMQS